MMNSVWLVIDQSKCSKSFSALTNRFLGHWHNNNSSITASKGYAFNGRRIDYRVNNRKQCYTCFHNIYILSVSHLNQRSQFSTESLSYKPGRNRISIVITFQITTESIIKLMAFNIRIGESTMTIDHQIVFHSQALKPNTYRCSKIKTIFYDQFAHISIKFNGKR